MGSLGMRASLGVRHVGGARRRDVWGVREWSKKRPGLPLDANLSTTPADDDQDQEKLRATDAWASPNDCNRHKTLRRMLKRCSKRGRQLTPLKSSRPEAPTDDYAAMLPQQSEPVHAGPARRRATPPSPWVALRCGWIGGPLPMLRHAETA